MFEKHMKEERYIGSNTEGKRSSLSKADYLVLKKGEAEENCEKNTKCRIGRKRRRKKKGKSGRIRRASMMEDTPSANLKRGY